MESRNACEGKFGDDLTACLAKLEALEARKDQMAGNEEYARELDALKKKNQAAWEKFKAMKSAGEEEWPGHKTTVGNSIIALQKALDESYSRFHD